MNPARRTLPALLLLANSAFAQAQPGTVVQAPQVIVVETLLSADAAGTSRVRFDATAPAATHSLGTLANRVANLHINTGGAGSFGDLIVLRGLSNTPYFSDPSVTVYFDDLPLGSAFSYPTGLFGFASATIARGPQGTAYGRGGEAGVILLSSTEPGPVPAGELRVSAGNFNLRTAAVEVRSARGDKADVTVSASFLERDGYIHNRTLGLHVDDQLGYSAAARLRLRPTVASELTLQLLGNRRRDGAQPLVPLNGPLYSVRRTREGSTDSDFGGAAFKAAFDTSLGRLTSTTSRTAWKLMPYDNRLTLPPTLDSRIDQSQRIWNEELRLASGAKSFVTWHAGAWFSSGKTDGDVNRAIPGLFPIEVSSFKLGSKTSALFAEATVPPNIGWTVTVGLRLEKTKKDFGRSQRVPAPGRITANASFGAVLPKLSASYAFTNETTASATVSAGAKPGGWSAYTANAALAGFRAEKATAFEAGVDTSFAGKTITLAARVFAYRIRDYQIERSFNAVDYLVVNAPRARSTGAELEVAWHATPRLTFTAAFGLTSVELREFTDPFSGRNYSGKRAPYAPEYEGHIEATYRAGKGLFAAAEWVATGKTFFDESESAAGMVGAHSVFHGRVGYETPRWHVSLYGENLGSDDHYTLIIPGVRHAVPVSPTTWGVQVVLKW